MGRGGLMGDAFSFSGILKMWEAVLIFCALMVHRFGDHGNYVFFATAARQLSPGDPGMHAENVGNGALIMFAIVSPVLLLSYIIDGRSTVQLLFLEPFWNFLGIALFAGVGVKSLIVWVPAKSSDDFTGTEGYFTNYSAGLALGSLCLIISLSYMIDFCVSVSARSTIKKQEVQPARYDYNY